jgi:hypothetical protein
MASVRAVRVCCRSRCARFRFLALGEEAVMARLHVVAKKEHLALDGDTCRALAGAAGGDLRRAITLLQNAVCLHGAAPLTPSAIYDVAGIVPPQALAAFWTVRDAMVPNRPFSSTCATASLRKSVHALAADDLRAREPLYRLHCVQAVTAQRVDLVQSAVLDLQRHGFSAQPVLKQIVRDLLLVASDHVADAGCNGGVIAKSASRAGPPCMSAAAIALAVRQCALVDGDLGQGCDEGMQLLRLGCFLVQCTSQTCTTNRFILEHALG